ncbi:hypothetical protein VR41_12400 [Streptomyces sp. NRRL B-1568]|nr:hypothetical protein VR41_12400 [Streptomyces sp. NRRL B-1568]
MGRHKRQKPRRSPDVELERPEWFGTAFHSVDGMQHLDVRPSGNGILITATPAEGDGRPAQWQLRLRNEDGGQGLRDLGTALVAGRAHLFGLYGENFLAFTPDIPDEGVGALVRAREVTGGSEAGVVVERRAERPMALWAEAGENLLRLLPLLNTAETVPTEVENCEPCPGCGRPVYDSSLSFTLLGPVPLSGLCRLCAEGTTRRLLTESGVPVARRHQYVLEAAAATQA